jgi:hypothetical protein
VLARAQARVRRKGSGRAAERGHGQRQSGRPAGKKNRGGVGHWEKEERGKEALARGATWPERDRGRGERRAQAGKRRRQVGPSWQREEGREVKALGLGCTEGSGPRRPMRGRREGEGKSWAGVERREGRGERAGPKGLFLLLFFSFSFSTFKPSKQIYMNSNKFEFNPINSTQIKQCASMNAQAS